MIGSDHHYMVYQRDGLHWYTTTTQASLWYRFNDDWLLIAPNIYKDPIRLPQNWTVSHP
jgi:protein associated with RNAse G/E